jgi:hypothetical protein
VFVTLDGMFMLCWTVCVCYVGRYVYVTLDGIFVTRYVYVTLDGMFVTRYVYDAEK